MRNLTLAIPFDGKKIFSVSFPFLFTANKDGTIVILLKYFGFGAL